MQFTVTLPSSTCRLWSRPHKADQLGSRGVRALHTFMPVTTLVPISKLVPQLIDSKRTKRPNTSLASLVTKALLPPWSCRGWPGAIGELGRGQDRRRVNPASRMSSCSSARCLKRCFSHGTECARYRNEQKLQATTHTKEEALPDAV